MTIVINGSGTMTGISVGGLNDNIITKNEMATNGAWAPAGTVLQVVQGSVGGGTITVNSSSFISLGLSASITPTSATSKILCVMFLNQVYTASSGRSCYTTIYRNGSNIAPTGSGINQNFGQLYCDTAVTLGNMTSTYLDSPATTSAVTYAIYAANSGGNVVVNQNSGTSFIQLLEIAA